MMYRGTYSTLMGFFFVTLECSRDVYIWVKISCLKLIFVCFNIVVLGIKKTPEMGIKKKIAYLTFKKSPLNLGTLKGWFLMMSKLNIATASKCFAVQMYFSVNFCISIVYFILRCKLEGIVVILDISCSKIRDFNKVK